MQNHRSCQTSLLFKMAAFFKLQHIKIVIAVFIMASKKKNKNKKLNNN